MENALNTHKYNGKIEFLRFVFCMCVLLFHGQKYFFGEASLSEGIRPSLFVHGAIGVEFFFVLSGFLMAKTAYKKVNSGKAEALGNETFQFIIHKIKGLLPYHLITFVFSTMTFIILNNYGVTDIIKCLTDALPNLFLVQMFGFNGENPNHVEWYISAMLISMLLLYPIMMKNYERFVYVIAPIISLIILIYLSYTYCSLTGVMVWTGFCYKSVLRAIAEIALGTVAFEICRKFSELKLSKFNRVIITLLELGCFAAIIIFVIFTFPEEYEFQALFAITLLVILAFSNQTFYPAVFDSALIKWMGKFTLPLYLCQVSGINIVLKFGENWSPVKQIIIYMVLTLLLSVVCVIITSMFKKRETNKALEKA